MNPSAIDNPMLAAQRATAHGATDKRSPRSLSAPTTVDHGQPPFVRRAHHDDRTFAAMLDDQASGAVPDELREVAVQFVGMGLFLPILSAARNGPFRTDLFHGGFAEDAFGSRMDQRMADEMARGDVTGLVDAIVDRYGRMTGREVDRHG